MFFIKPQHIVTQGRVEDRYADDSSVWVDERNTKWT